MRLAGAVRGRRDERATASDWMELERRRGISISTTVLPFDYEGLRVNLLDTPGHRDFSEDTYRVLAAVDSAVMVLDAAKGIEAQTLKLFEVCRRRGVPIFTFVNKMDRPGRDPLDLLDEIERTLDLRPFAVTWPVGTGLDFRGVYDRKRREAHLFERTPGGARPAPFSVRDAADPRVGELLGADARRRFLEEIALLDAAGAPFDEASIRAGGTTPVFFGSALHNFGVRLFLDAFLASAPPPAPRRARAGPVPPEHPSFSAFVFKVQANMDPRHRDRVAFARVCSGRFDREMPVHHSGTGRTVRLSNAHTVFGRDREAVDEAWPGDIVGLVGHDEIRIGDTLTEDPGIVYDEVPRFAPECFAALRNPNPSDYKRFRSGLDQLVLEGVARPFSREGSDPHAVLLGAVGPLQFEVLRYRLQSEYGADSILEPVPVEAVRWTAGADGAGDAVWAGAVMPTGVRRGADEAGRPVLFFPDRWSIGYFAERNPSIRLLELPPGEG